MRASERERDPETTEWTGSADDERGRESVEYPQPGPPLGFYLVLAAILVVAAVYSVTMITIGGSIRTPATAIAAMTGVFTVIGTLVGTYFGMKAGLDGQDKVRQAVDGTVRGRERSRDRARR